jgi:proteasome lid subunit RPN8/RPN11
MTEPVRIPRAVVNQILHQAQHDPAVEVCGLISGEARGLRRCYPVANVAGDTRRLFEMDPKGLIDALREMREHGEELRAIYHSHPEAPAEPSLEDVRQSEYPGVLYLIVSLGTQGVLDLRGFYIRDGRIEDVEIGL